MKRFPRWPLAALPLLLRAAAPAAAQGGVAASAELFAGSATERYLRVLQVAGRAPLSPWSVRAFVPPQAARLLPADSANPWGSRLGWAADSGATHLSWILPEARLVGNTGFGYGENDGPLWAGRGLTASVQGGAAFRSRHLWLTLAPVAFVAQNAGGGVIDNGQQGKLAFGDSRFPSLIDQPQRFGDGAYARLDPGESSVGATAGPLMAGFSTAAEVWGPGDDYPLVLGNNAGGFPHAFVGTVRPVGIGIGAVHLRVLWGRLDQSAYADMPADSTLRFMSGFVATFVPRGIPGLELGTARFFHSPWPDRLADAPFKLPFQAILKSHLSGSAAQAGGGDAANQLASAFFRWAAPRDGFEVWGEFARDDHSFDLRDFVMEPDHEAAYSLGLRKVWSRADGGLVSLRAELVDAQITHLTRVRGEAPFYIHAALRQGHTERGQILASPAAYGGGGATLALDTYSRRGGWSFTLAREGLGQMVGPDRVLFDSGERVAAGAARILFLRRAQVSAGATALYEMGTHGRRDRFDLNTVLTARLLP